MIHDDLENVVTLGEQARDEAVARVEGNAKEAWKKAALRAICITAAANEIFLQMSGLI
jgi:hypothetical protein